MKKRWFVATLLVGVLAIGITGGTVLAQTDGTNSDSLVGKFASKVAAILGLDETKVQDALKQAAGEIQDEALQRKLDHMVEIGRLTQEQADDYYEWYQSKPEGIFPGRGFGGHGFLRGSMMGRHGGYGMGFWQQTPPAPESTETTSL